MTKPMTPEQVIDKIWGIAMGRDAAKPQMARRIEAAIKAQSAEVDRLTEEVEKWKGIAVRINDGLETLTENTDAEHARLRAQVTDLTLPCVHCGEPIHYNRAWGHVRGPGSRLQSCDTAKSGLPYGYNAHPEGVQCRYPCKGASGDEVQSGPCEHGKTHCQCYGEDGY